MRPSTPPMLEQRRSAAAFPLFIAQYTLRSLHCRTQDSEPVTALALSPDGRHVFAASRSLQQRCWSLETGAALRSYRGHRAPVADLAVDASGALLASSSADRSVRVWDVDGGYCTHAFTGHRWGLRRWVGAGAHSSKSHAGCCRASCRMGGGGGLVVLVLAARGARGAPCPLASWGAASRACCRACCCSSCLSSALGEGKHGP